MATFFKIASATVGSGGASSIDFASIPSTYTDLVLKISARGARTSFAYDGFTLTFNDSSSGYSGLWLRGNGSSASSGISPYTSYIDDILGVNGPSSTSNTFSNLEFYIPNYAGNANKSVYMDGVLEDNTAEAYATISANLWSNTSAITKISFGRFNANFVQYTTATLYGIKKS
jgi:hypothetical protein